MESDLEMRGLKSQVTFPFFIVPKNTHPVVSADCMGVEYLVLDSNTSDVKRGLPGWWDDEGLGFTVEKTVPWAETNFAKIKRAHDVEARYKESVKAAQQKYRFVIDANTMESQLCFVLKDDAVENSLAHVNLRIEATVGPVSVLPQYWHLFRTECFS